MDFEKENLRLIEQNCGLIRENEYLKMLLERLIPIPVNMEIEGIKDNYRNIEKRVRKIENKDINTN